MGRLLRVLCPLGLLALAVPAIAGASVAPGFEESTVAGGLTQPTAVAFRPDGGMLVTERGGAVLSVRGGATVTLMSLAVCTKRSLPAGKDIRIRLGLRNRVRASLRRAARQQPLSARLRLAAVDGSGNVARLARKIRLR